MTKRQGKTKSSPAPKQLDPPKSEHVRDGTPFLHFATPSHRIPGQPVGINYSQDRSKYDANFHPTDFVKCCQEGMTKAEIAAAWGIGLSTLSRWCEDHPAMVAVYEVGHAAQQAWLARKIRNNLDNKGTNATLLIFSAKNLLGWGDEARTDFDDVQTIDVDFDVTRRK